MRADEADDRDLVLTELGRVYGLARSSLQKFAWNVGKIERFLTGERGGTVSEQSPRLGPCRGASIGQKERYTNVFSDEHLGSNPCLAFVILDVFGLSDGRDLVDCHPKPKRVSQVRAGKQMPQASV